MVFQPPQASHLPDHFEEVVPQDWQTKLACPRAISGTAGGFATPHPRLRETEEPALHPSPTRGEGKYRALHR